jgi:S1-C subfamily serine protease
MARTCALPGLLSVLLGLTVPAAAQSADEMADARAALNTKDYKHAIGLLRPLADRGNLAAEHELAVLYFRGLGTDPDQAKGLKLFQAVAATGNAEAEKDLGVAYQTGGPGVGNDVEAVKWFRASADQGNVQAETYLGFMYGAGRGVARDYKESLRWNAKAAEQGNAAALSNIAAAFARGQGVPQDYSQALFWINTAMERMSKDDPGRAAHDKFVQDVAVHLSANDVARITAAARNWRPGKGSTDGVLKAAGLPIEGGTVAPPVPGASPGGQSGLATGSGLVIDHAGDVLTNNHVVDHCSAIRVKLANGEPIGGTVLAADRAGDLAVVRLNGILGEPAILRDKAARQGETVLVAGFPLSGLLTSDMNVSEGIVSALSGAGDNTRQIQISAPIQSGNSGGPVFDSDGAVIAVVQSGLNATALAFAGATSQNANFAIKTTSVREFLDAKSISYEHGNSGKLHGSLSDYARRSTVFIECQH